MSGPRAEALRIRHPRVGEVHCLFGSGPEIEGAPPLLLCHAAGAAARNFGSLLRRLPPSTVAIDLPGPGRTPGAAPRSIEESAEILRAVADALVPAGRVALGGHSMGAAVAIAAAADAGAARVAGAVAIAAGARPRVSPELVELAERDFDAFLATYAAGAAAMTIQALRDTGQATVAADLRACLGFDLLERARRYGGPLLVIGGERDRAAPRERLRELADGAGGKLVMIPEAGHVVPVEKPDETAAAIRAWLANDVTMGNDRK